MMEELLGAVPSLNFRLSNQHAPCEMVDVRKLASSAMCLSGTSKAPSIDELYLAYRKKHSVSVDDVNIVSRNKHNASVLGRERSQLQPVGQIENQ